MVFIKQLKLILFFAAIVSVWACAEKIFTFDVDCSECFFDRPDEVELIVYTSVENNESIELIIYEGKTGAEVSYLFTLTEKEVRFLVEPNKEYSAEAVYTRNGKNYTVTDGTKVKLKSVSETCEADPCWYAINNELNLQLKY